VTANLKGSFNLAKAKKKQKKDSRFQTARKVQKNVNRLLDLPVWMRLIGFLFIFRTFGGNRGQTQAQKDYDEAIRFLRESQGFTGKR
jgi:hypothetical protein